MTYVTVGRFHLETIIFLICIFFSGRLVTSCWRYYLACFCLYGRNAPFVYFVQLPYQNGSSCPLSYSYLSGYYVTRCEGTAPYRQVPNY